MVKIKVRWLSNGSKQPLTLSVMTSKQHHYSDVDPENHIPAEDARENYQDRM